ncbi:MAG: YgiT-type zinc finger protein [archaeon]|nr:YgiT-type zinc finger protein [archaeon]
MGKELTCHLCSGKAVLKFEEFELDNGKIIIKESPYYKCSECKEEFVTSEQMAELSNQINNNFVFSRPIINAGRSLAITLPSDIVQYYHLKKGEKIKLIPENKKEIRLKIE